MVSTERLKAVNRQVYNKIDQLKDRFECAPMDTQHPEWLLLKRLERIMTRLNERIMNRRLGEVIQALTQGYRSFD